MTRPATGYPGKAFWRAMKTRRMERAGINPFLTKDQARALCEAAATLVEPRKVPELPTSKRFKQYWRAFHDYTKK